MKKFLWLLAFLPFMVNQSCDLDPPTPPEEPPPPPPTTRTDDCGKCVVVDRERGDHACEEFMIDFQELSPAAIRRNEEALREEGFVKVKDCMCGEELQLWRMSPDIDLEDGMQAARDKIGLQGDDFLDYNFQLFLGPFPDRGQIPTGDQVGIGPGGGPKTSKVEVAIIDSGIDLFHAGLQPILWENPALYQTNDDCIAGDRHGYDFQDNDVMPLDPYGHGTHLAGIIGRNYPADIDLRILPLKFHDGQQGFLFDAVCAIYYAVKKEVDVINLSWGFESPKPPPILTRAIKYAVEKGIVVVTSAGNAGADNDSNPHWPSNYDQMVLAVANLNSANNNLVGNSNFGQNLVDLAAPGEFIVSTFPTNDFKILTGTSMAAANVSRVASIIKAKHPGAAATDVMNCILSTVTPLSPQLDTKVRTKGFLNEAGALSCTP